MAIALCSSTVSYTHLDVYKRQHMLRRHKNNHIAVLRRQAVMGGGGAVPDVIRSGDVAGESQEIAVAQSIRPLFRGDEQIFPPARPFDPAFAAQRLDHMVLSLIHI